MDYELLGKWVAKRAEEADSSDVQLEYLKTKVRLATQAVTEATGDAVQPALGLQTKANWALIQYLASKHK